MKAFTVVLRPSQLSRVGGKPKTFAGPCLLCKRPGCYLGQICELCKGLIA